MQKFGRLVAFLFPILLTGCFFLGFKFVNFLNPLWLLDDLDIGYSLTSYLVEGLVMGGLIIIELIFIHVFVSHFLKRFPHLLKSLKAGMIFAGILALAYPVVNLLLAFVSGAH